MSGLSGLLQCPWKRPITIPFLCSFPIAAVALPFPDTTLLLTHARTHTHTVLWVVSLTNGATGSLNWIRVYANRIIFLSFL